MKLHVLMVVVVVMIGFKPRASYMPSKCSNI